MTSSSATWGGLRTDLHDRGIDFGIRLSQYGQWVAGGGIENAGRYGGTLDYRLNTDLAKLFGSWEGLSVNMHARTRFGKDVSASARTVERVLRRLRLMLLASSSRSSSRPRVGC